MSLRFVSTGVATAAVIVVVAGCSSSTADPPQVILQSSVTTGSNGTACPISSTQWVNLGDFGNPSATPSVDPTPVRDQDLVGGQKAAVACSVTREGDSYRVTASGQIAGFDGGSIAVTGLFTDKGVQNDIEVVFNRADYGTYIQMNCTADYSALSVMGVAPGRVWAEATCEKIVNMSQSVERDCKGTVQFRFENCTQ